MELIINSERVLEAAETCRTAKEILKVLFPEVFVNDMPKMGDRYRGPNGLVYLIAAIPGSPSRYILINKDLGTYYGSPNTSLENLIPPGFEKVKIS